MSARARGTSARLGLDCEPAYRRGARRRAGAAAGARAAAATCARACAAAARRCRADCAANHGGGGPAEGGAVRAGAGAREAGARRAAAAAEPAARGSAAAAAGARARAAGARGAAAAAGGGAGRSRRPRGRTAPPRLPAWCPGGLAAPTWRMVPFSIPQAAALRQAGARIEEQAAAAGLKWPPPCLTTPPHRPPWTIWRLRPLLRTPERSLSRLEARRGLGSSPQGGRLARS